MRFSAFLIAIFFLSACARDKLKEPVAVAKPAPVAEMPAPVESETKTTEQARIEAETKAVEQAKKGAKEYRAKAKSDQAAKMSAPLEGVAKPTPAPVAVEKRCTAGGVKVECPTQSDADVKKAAEVFGKEAADLSEGKGGSTYGVSPFDYLTGVGKRTDSGTKSTFKPINGDVDTLGAAKDKGFKEAQELIKADIPGRARATEEHQRRVPAMANGGSTVAMSPALGADQERMHQRDEYIKGLQKGAYTFNPPSPIKVDERIVLALWVDPAKEAAQLAEDMKKSFPESTARIGAGTTTWSPRMRATLTGVDFKITPVEPGKDGKPFDGVKDLSMTGRTEWGWTIVPTFPGKKQLHLLLSVVLPPELGEPHELPAMNRDIQVDVTIWWLIDHYWEKYWKWLLGSLGTALATAIAYLWKNRRRVVE